MSVHSNNKKAQLALAQKFSSLKLWGWSFLAGTVASLLCSSTGFSAVESVGLKYRDLRTVVPIAEFETFVQGGAMTENLQRFFQRIPLSPKLALTLLADPIVPSKSFRLDPITAEFVAIQFNKLVGTPLNEEPRNTYQALVKAAFADDKSLSVLELTREYPEPQVRVELSRLEQIHNDVSLFMERIEPIMELVQEVIVDEACGCELTPRGPARILPETNLPKSSGQSGIGHQVYAQLPAFADRATIAATSEPNAIALHTANARSQQLVSSRAPVAISPATPGNPNSATSKQIVFTYGPLESSLRVGDLVNFVNTGEMSRPLLFYLRFAKVQPEDLRSLLTKEINADLRRLDRNLNSLLGEYALFQIGRVVHSRSRQANIQALRSTLTISASNDNRISPIELLQNYPLSQMYVDGARLSQLLRSIRRAGGAKGFALEKLNVLEDLLAQLRAAAATENCECQSN